MQLADAHKRLASAVRAGHVSRVKHLIIMRIALRQLALVAALAFLGISPLRGQTPGFAHPAVQTNREVLLGLGSVSNQNYRLQVSTNLADWHSLATIQSTGLLWHTDTAAPFHGQRFYRAFQDATNALTGDHLPTAAGEVVMHLFGHASFLLQWSNRNIYVDPTATTYVSQGFPRADLILVTHDHNDHYSRNALNGLTNANTVIIAPLVIWTNLRSSSSPLTNLLVTLTNGAATTWQGAGVEAVPAYNANHPKGRGNGYVLTIGGVRFYISGDTSDTVEMQALPNIDYAFLCMDGQFNMNITNAAAATRTFRPKVVYPYHYNSANPAIYKQLVGADLGIEVRLRKWE